MKDTLFNLLDHKDSVDLGRDSLRGRRNTFLAGGYPTPEALRASIARTRSMTGRPFGVNIFVPGRGPADPDAVRRYTDRLRPEVARAGVALGKPRVDADHYATKLALLRDEAPAVVSFTFGCPESAIIDDLQRRGCAVWVTVTGPGEAGRAGEAGADALVVQGIEAGGHRGGFDDREEFRARPEREEPREEFRPNGGEE